MARTIVFAVLALIVLASISSAGCATTAYEQSCTLCSFDAQGKMNQTCYQQYQASGVACVSAQYPVATAAFTAGKCPGIQTCADTLQTCKAAIASGNDSEDCQGGVMAQCFKDADLCVAKAAADCGDKVPCINAPASFVLLAGAVFFYGKQKESG